MLLESPIAWVDFFYCQSSSRVKWENEDHIGHAWSSALSAKAEDEDEDG